MILWNDQAAKFGFRLFWSFWNVTGTSAATLHFNLMRFGGKTSYRLVNGGQGPAYSPNHGQTDTSKHNSGTAVDKWRMKVSATLHKQISLANHASIIGDYIMTIKIMEIGVYKHFLCCLWTYHISILLHQEWAQHKYNRIWKTFQNNKHRHDIHAGYFRNIVVNKSDDLKQGIR